MYNDPISHLLLVICHDVILASATDTTAQIASRKCSFLALDALEGDPEFMTRTCDCRELTDARKANKKRARASNANSAGQLKLDADGDVVIPDANASSEHEEGEDGEENETAVVEEVLGDESA